MQPERVIAYRTVLLHVYELDSEDTNHPDKQGNLSIDAVVRLCREEGVNRVVVPGARLFGKDTPELATVYANALRSKCADNVTITISPTMQEWNERSKSFKDVPVKDTSREIEAGLQVVELEAEEIESVTADFHQSRIWRGYRHRGYPARVRSAEEILTTRYHKDPSDPLHKEEEREIATNKQLIRMIHSTENYRKYRFREGLRRIICFFPIGEKALQKIADNMVSKPKITGK